MNQSRFHAKPTDLLSIGQFAARSRLSLKALRLYDSIELLPAAYVDPESGYRYYRDEQLQRARLISLLRHLDMPLKQIADLLNAPHAEAIDRLMQYWQTVEERITEQRRMVQYIRESMQGKEPTMTFELQVRETPSQPTICIGREVTIQELEPFICNSFERLQHHLQAQHSQPVGPGFVIYHGQVNEDSHGPVEVCLPIAGNISESEDMYTKQYSGGQEVFTRISREQCRFPEILQAYDAVAQWIHAHGHQMAASPREIYFNQAESIAPDDPFCDIAWQFRVG